MLKAVIGGKSIHWHIEVISLLCQVYLSGLLRVYVLFGGKIIILQCWSIPFTEHLLHVRQSTERDRIILFGGLFVCLNIQFLRMYHSCQPNISATLWGRSSNLAQMSTWTLSWTDYILEVQCPCNLPKQVVGLLSSMNWQRVVYALQIVMVYETNLCKYIVFPLRIVSQSKSKFKKVIILQYNCNKKYRMFPVSLFLLAQII